MRETYYLTYKPFSKIPKGEVPYDTNSIKNTLFNILKEDRELNNPNEIHIFEWEDTLDKENDIMQRMVQWQQVR